MPTAASKAANRGATVVRFTDATVKEWLRQAQPGQRREYQDADNRKLFARVSPGRAAYSLVAWSPALRKARRVSLGTHQTVNVKMLRVQAQAALNAILQNEPGPAERRAQTIGNATTVAERLDAHIAEQSLRPRTGETYRYEVTALLGPAVHRPLASLSPEAVLACYRARCTPTEALDRFGRPTVAGSPTGANIALAALRALCRQNELDDVTRLARLKGGKHTKGTAARAARLSPEQARDLVAWLLDRAEATGTTPGTRTQCHMLLTALTMGLRIGTVRALQAEWVDFRHGTVAIPGELMKAKRAVVLPVPSQTLALWKARKGTSLYLFPSATNPDKPANVDANFVGTLPFECSHHDARKAFNALLMQQGVDVYARWLLMTHTPTSDVNFKHYLQTAAKDTLLRVMRPASTATEKFLWGKVGSRKTLAEMRALHADRAESFHVKRRPRAAAAKRARRART